MLFLALCVLYNITLPIFEAPDEGDHFHYADFLARERRLPHLERDLPISHEIIQPPLYYAAVALIISPFDRSDLPSVSRLNPDWFDPTVNADHRSVTNQYLHTPAEDFPYSGTVWAVRAARLFSSLLGALTVLFVYAIARTVFSLSLSGRREGGEGVLPFLAAALVALNPKFINISSIVNNDIAITLAATVTCWWMVRWWGTGDRGWGLARSPSPTPHPLSFYFLLGVFIGLAVLCKVTGLGLLIPAVALVVLGNPFRPFLERRGERARTFPFAEGKTMGILSLGAGLALTAGWWFVYNVIQYDHPLAWAQVQAANQSLLRQPPLTFTQIVQSIPEILVSYWGVIGIELRYPSWVNTVFFVILALAVVGCGLWVAGDRLKVQTFKRSHLQPSTFNLQPLTPLILWELILLASYALWLRNYVGTENSRLIFPGIALAALLTALGWCSLTPARARSGMTLGACTALALLSAVTPFAVIRPAFATPAYLSEQQIAALPGRVGVSFGGKIRLLHAQTESQRNVQPGDAVRVSLYWGALQPLNQSYHTILTAHDAQGNLIGRIEAIPFNGRFDTQRWQPGQLFRDDYQLPIDADARRGLATVQVSVRGVYEDPPLLPIDGADTNQFLISTVKVLGPLEPAPAPAHPLSATFSRAGEPLIQLEGVDAETTGDERRTLTLHWRCLKPLDRDYTLFIHVVDESGNIISQQDAPPSQSSQGVRIAYPTDMWDAGEQILDQRTIDLPSSARQLHLGWYAPPEGTRLEAYQPDGSPWPDNTVVLDVDIIR